ncbi:Arc family DNA-binding protein [Rhizobium sp. LjRoot30]|uniref:Arc family DNA-binding protein n=1 Tax=Rhizobium sp. LjRoot30 TaxID=3342320 RepID=UPI003ECD3C62
MSNNEYYLRLRIPETVRRQLMKSATLNNRSMTAEILTRLQTSFESGDNLGTADDELQAMQERLLSLEEQFRRHIAKANEHYPSRKAFRIAGE